MRFIQKLNYHSVFFLLLYTIAYPSNYYVSKYASGQNNGTSWANAWQSFSAINWNLIQPGDLIYISGGTDSTIYYEQLTVNGKNGTAANRITIIAGKYSPSSTGHSGRVIIDGGGTRAQSIHVHDSKYVTIKGFELRHANRGVYVEGDIWVSNVILDSLNIYDFYDQAGIFLNGHQNIYSVESTTIRNCRVVTPLLVAGQTDCIYMQGAQNTFIHNNYIRNLNQDPLAHNDALQAYHCNGFMIYNNVLINDSVYSPEGGGMPIILGAEGNNPVVIYNNFIYMGGAWYEQANMGGALCLRWYDVFPMPPTYVINNTIVVNGPRVRGFWWEYGCNLTVNNIIAMYCPPAYRNLSWMSNLDVAGYNVSGGLAIVNNIRNNLFWKMDWDIGFTGQYMGNGHTGGVSGWSSWMNTYGGTGTKADPLFVFKIGLVQDQGALTGELQPGSPAINQGENVRTLIESFGLPWTDINGNPRDNTPTIGAYEYTSGSGKFPLVVHIKDGRNLVSVPGINQNGMGINNWWAYRDMSMNVFKYLGGYQTVTTTTPGVGYWMKHSGARTYNTGDEWPTSGIEIVPHIPIEASSGWNMFGGYELSVSTSGLTTNPPGLIVGFVYKHSDGFQAATTLDPGYGYWLKLNAAGQIIIPETIAKGEPAEFFPSDWGRIILTDAAGINYTLYAVKGDVDLNQYELPPAPPEGMFDIRYSSGRIAEDLNSTIKTIEMRGVTYPLTVQVENMDIRLQDETVKQINTNLKSGEDVVISDRTIDKLLVSSELKPTRYALEQNYPNPFNPATTIMYSIKDKGFVTLKVYDILGKEIATLINEEQIAGSYKIKFESNSSGLWNLASGIYLYRLESGDFVSTKKMILLK